MREPTEMELRVAKAIYGHMFPERHDGFGEDARLKGCYIDCARTAIQAMREPTEDVVNAGCFPDTGDLYWKRGYEEDRMGLADDEHGESYLAFTKRSYTAMIHAASPPDPTILDAG